MMKRKKAMLATYDRFAERMAKRYSQVRDCLVANRYEEAHILLAEMGVSHARTTMSLRNVLVQSGALEPEK